MDFLAERRGRWVWYAYGACVVLFVLLAPSYGRVALAVGVLGSALGIERLAAIWGQKRRWVCIAFLAWLAIGVLALVLPIWEDSTSQENRDGATRHHHHSLWQGNPTH